MMCRCGDEHAIIGYWRDEPVVECPMCPAQQVYYIAGHWVIIAGGWKDFPGRGLPQEFVAHVQRADPGE